MAQKLPIRLRTIAAAIVVVASGLIIFNVYQSIIGASDNTLQALPIISAPSQPFRILPDDPGGADIPNQGSKLYNVMDANQADPLALGGASLSSNADKQASNDHLLIEEDDTGDAGAGVSGFELPEAPESRTESLYGMIEDLKDRPSEDEVDITPDDGLEPLSDADKKELKKQLAEVVQKEKDEAAKEAMTDQIIDEVEANKNASSKMNKDTDQKTGKVAHPIDPSILPRPSTKPTPPVKRMARVTPPRPTSSPARSANDTNKEQADATFSLDRVLNAVPAEKHYIQLASLRDEESAKNAYERIKNDFPALVSGLGVVYPSVDLGARGTFVRVQIGPVSEAEAKRRCAQYVSSSRGGTCLVVRR